MEKISILMNCYNGEKYLDEAIQSVINQKYKNWEIIFVDNCSTDNSANIAKKFGSKIKYYKTKRNLPLGEARKYGVSYCGKYISVLDVDDRWLPETLQELYYAIKSGDYALSYGQQYQINNEGVRIGKIANKYAGRKGNFFEKLLLQYEIPIVCALFDKNKMLEMGLNFDEKIYGSEEYCLFLQLSIKTEFISVNKYLVEYRLHDSLTTKLDKKIYEERFYTLNKIVENYPEEVKKYSGALNVAYERGYYYKAQYYANSRKKFKALKELSKIAFKDIRYFLLMIVLIMPRYFCWDKIQKLKYKR